MTLYKMMIWLTMSGVLSQLLEAWIGLMQKGFWQSWTRRVTISWLSRFSCTRDGSMFMTATWWLRNMTIFSLIQFVFELLPKLLQQSGIMNHLPKKLLTQPWEFNGRVESIVQNRIGAVCESYSFAFIEHLISRTHLQPPKTLLYDNLIE